MSFSEQDVDGFGRFMGTAEPRLRLALSAALGTQVGREATADVLSHVWENWERVQTMANPVGYLYVTGRDRGRQSRHRPQPVFYSVDPSRRPWVKPHCRLLWSASLIVNERSWCCCTATSGRCRRSRTCWRSLRQQCRTMTIGVWRH